MKFEYTPEVEETREVVAELFHMTGEPKQVCLNIHHTHSSVREVTTIYYDGQVFSQDAFDTGNCNIKKFYKGDTITMTF